MSSTAKKKKKQDVILAGTRKYQLAVLQAEYPSLSSG